MMNRYFNDMIIYLKILSLAFVLPALMATPLIAETCTEDGVCLPDPISLPLFCGDDPEATLNLGLNQDFDIQFTATLNRKTPGRLDMYALDGTTSIDGKNEIKVTNMKCSYNKTNSQSLCTGVLTLEKEAKLSEQFNFGQAVIDFTLRKGKNNLCMGKLLNDLNQIVQNGLLERAFCSVTSLGRKRAPDVTGFGFFDPRGYGQLGESHFHLSVQGLPENQKLQACIPSKKSYASAFSFRAFGADETDASIYGTLNDEESAKLSGEATAYSYDLWRQVTQEANPSAFFGKSLSQINRQVSPPSASSGRSTAKSSLKKRLKRERNNKKRKRKKNKRKSASTNSVTASGNTSKSQIFNWLTFDPIAENVFYLATNCNKKTATKAYAQVSCSKDSNAIAGAECANGSATDSEGKEIVSRICRTSNALIPMTVRVAGLVDGSYFVCADNVVLDKKLAVVSYIDSAYESDPRETYGDLNVTANTTIKAAIDTYAISKTPLADIQTITISKNDDCSSPLVTAAF